MRQSGARLIRRTAGRFKLRDALLERPIVEFGGVNLRDRELAWCNALESPHSRRLADDVLVGVVNFDLPHQPSAGGVSGCFVGVDHALEDPSGAVVDADLVENDPAAAARYHSNSDEVVALKHPDVADDFARGRDALVVVVRPRIDLPCAIDDDAFVECEQRR